MTDDTETGHILDAFTPKNLNYHGTAYEQKIIMLFIARGLVKGSPFQLASGMDEAGSFDDLVMNWQLPHNCNRLTFLQSKHSNSAKRLICLKDLMSSLMRDGKRRKADWCLQMYFETFLKMKKCGKFKGANVEMKEFILCCNFGFEDGAVYRENNQILELTQDIFEDYQHDVLPNVVRKFKRNFHGRALVVSKLGEVDEAHDQNDIEEFIDKLVFAVKQPDESTLVEIIKQDIIQISGFRDLNLETIYSAFQTEVSDWVNSSNGRPFTSVHGRSIFAKEMEKMNNQTFYERMKALGMSFHNDIIQELKLNQALEKSGLLILTNPGHAVMSTIKVLQVLDSLDRFRPNNYLLTCLNDFVRLKVNILDFVSIRSHPFLMMIECSGDNAPVDILHEISSALMSITANSDKKCVLIGRENDSFVKIFKEKCNAFDEIIDNKNNFCHLSRHSQTAILERKISFHGIQIPLKKIIPFEQLKKIIDDETSIMLANNEKIVIGDNLASLGEVADYYINRSVSRHVNISPDVLKMDIPDLFAIGNAEESELIKIVKDGAKKHGDELMQKTLRLSSRKGLKSFESMFNQILINSDMLVNPDNKTLTRKYGEVDPNRENPIRFIILNNEMKSECFQQLCLDYPKHIIHWVEKSENNLVWQKSQGSLSNIRHYLVKDEDTGNAFEPNDLTAIESKLIIVNGEPGMGKSCLLSHLALQTQELDPSLWIVRLNLPEIDKPLRNLNTKNRNEIVEEQAINLILNFKTLTCFEKNIFENAFNTLGRVVLIFDGFDEISDDGREGVIKLLHYLKNKPVRKIWVCSRPHAVNKLEDELSVFSHHLEPVSKPNQEIILKKIWKRNLNNFSDIDGHLFIFAKKLLNLFYETIHENEGRVFGIPLQTKMLADAFEKDCEKVYHAQENFSNLPVKINILDLYRRFVDIKLKLSFEDKLDGVRSICLQRILDDLRKKRIQIYQLLAVHSLFSDRDISCVLYENEKEIISQSIQNPEHHEVITEIIINITNNMPVFIHSTFADYFAARWFAKNLTRKEISQYFLSKILRYNNQINYKNPALNPPFSDALESASFINFNSYHSLFGPEEERYNVFRNLVDHILIDRAHKNEQRYNIYLAVLTNDPEYLIQILKELKHKNVLNSTDLVGKTPLHLAASYGYVKIANILLENMADVNICDDIFEWSALQYADAFMYWDIAACLLDKGAIGDHMHNAIKTIKQGKNSLLHVAVELDSFKFVKLLTENGADLNALDVHGNSALHNAARKGRLVLLQYFVNIDVADFSQFNTDGFALLHIAAEYLNFDIIKCIVNNSTCNIDQRSKYGLTALQLIMKINNSLDVVKYLVEITHSDINVKTPSKNRSILHLAAAYGKIEIVQYLVEKQNFNYIPNDSNGRTPAHDAALAGNLDIVKYFLEVKKVDSNTLTHDKQSLLHFAALSGKLDLIKYLVEEQNASCISTDSIGLTPAHYAALKGSSDIVKYFIEVKNVDLNILTHSKQSLVHFAAQSGNLDLIKYLVEEQNASCISADAIGRIPAHDAAFDGELDIVKYFLEVKKVDLNILTHDKQSLVHFAAQSGNLDLIKYLVEEQNASCNSTDSIGRTPAHYAALDGELDIVKYFLEVKNVDLNILTHSKQSLVHFAAQSGNLYLIKYLVEEQNASCISTDSTGRTPAHDAAFFGYSDIVKYFLEVQKVDLNILTHDKGSLVHFAAQSGNLKLIKYLVEVQNCKFIICNIYGFSPLHVAAINDRADAIEYLIEYFKRIRSKGCNEIGEFIDADISTETDVKSSITHISNGDASVGRFIDAFCLYGYTPLMRACSSGKIQAASMLLKYGANYHCHDFNGHTALHLAVYHGHEKIVELLIRYGANPNIVLQGFKTLLDIIVESKLYDSAAPPEVISRIYRLYLDKSIECIVSISEALSECHSAVKNDDLNELQRILEKEGLDANGPDLFGRTPLERACEYGRLNIVRYIIEWRTSHFAIPLYEIMSLLSLSIFKGQLEVVKYLFDFVRSDISKLSADLLLSLSVYSDSEEIISFLFHETKRICDNFAVYKNLNTTIGSSFLIACAELENRHSAQAFLVLGDDVNAQNNLGETALHAAVKCEHPKFVKFLLDNRADARIADKNGKTPLDLANGIMEKPYGYHECVKDMADLLKSDSGKL